LRRVYPYLPSNQINEICRKKCQKERQKQCRDALNAKTPKSSLKTKTSKTRMTRSGSKCAKRVSFDLTNNEVSEETPRLGRRCGRQTKTRVSRFARQLDISYGSHESARNESQVGRQSSPPSDTTRPPLDSSAAEEYSQTAHKSVTNSPKTDSNDQKVLAINESKDGNKWSFVSIKPKQILRNKTNDSIDVSKKADNKCHKEFTSKMASDENCNQKMGSKKKSYVKRRKASVPIGSVITVSIESNGRCDPLCDLFDDDKDPN